MFTKAAVVLFVLTIGISLFPDGSSKGFVSARPNPTDLQESLFHMLNKLKHMNTFRAPDNSLKETEGSPESFNDGQGNYVVNGHKGNLNFGTYSEQRNKVNPSSVGVITETRNKTYRIFNTTGNVTIGSTSYQEGNVYTA